jgi:hypothetical protein
MNKKQSLMILAALVFGISVFHFLDKSVWAQVKQDKAPAFTLKLLNGGDLKFTGLEVKLTVLKFVASY